MLNYIDGFVIVSTLLLALGALLTAYIGYRAGFKRGFRNGYDRGVTFTNTLAEKYRGRNNVRAISDRRPAA